MHTELYWVEGPWIGKLALAARPRGGDWLQDEIRGWHSDGIETVLSLLTPEEEVDLDLALEAYYVRSEGMEFVSFPIPDRQVPASEDQLSKALENLEADLNEGRNVVLHCRQGIGRTGLVAACLLLGKGLNPDTAVNRLSDARGVRIPETPEQRNWIEKYASAFSGVR